MGQKLTDKWFVSFRVLFFLISDHTGLIMSTNRKKKRQKSSMIHKSIIVYNIQCDLK